MPDSKKAKCRKGKKAAPDLHVACGIDSFHGACRYSLVRKNFLFFLVFFVIIHQFQRLQLQPAAFFGKDPVPNLLLVCNGGML